MEIKHQIIEGDSIHIFADELDYYTGQGFTVLASNSFCDFGNNKICYYALLVKNYQEEKGDIPLTYQGLREIPNLKID